MSEAEEDSAAYTKPGIKRFQMNSKRPPPEGKPLPVFKRTGIPFVAPKTEFKSLFPTEQFRIALRGQTLPTWGGHGMDDPRWSWGKPFRALGTPEKMPRDSRVAEVWLATGEE